MKILNNFKNIFSSNKLSIGDKSNNNFIMQGSSVENLIVNSNMTEMITALGHLEGYDTIQKIITDSMAAAREAHPLRPDFKVKYDNELQRLVSTPETEDAFKKYPKTIKGTFRLDYKKYPYMNRAETPWEYAYRTQTKVELETTAYQEYLGEIVDPFPFVEYKDGMTTVIGAPEFPPAVNASIISGDVSVPIMMRRKPCLEYNHIILGTVSNEKGFDINIIIYKDENKTTFKITKTSTCELSLQLQREKLINNIKETKQLCIMIGDSPLVHAEFKEEELLSNIFIVAPKMIEYLQNLNIIETSIGCKFDLSLEDVYVEDFRTAYILASSLQEKWHRIATSFDEVRCNYSNIPTDIEKDANSIENKVIEGRNLNISLQGQEFCIDKYITIYKNAKINNIKSIVKNCKRKKDDVLITFRPLKGYDYFYKYCKYEGIEISSI